MTGKAWIYIPTGSGGLELPFLIPTVLLLKDGKLYHVDHTRADYHANGLYHLKQALEKAAFQRWSDPALDSYRDCLGTSDADRLDALLHACAVYFLSGVLGEVRDHVRQRLPGFGTYGDDYIAVNLAVPVADAQRPRVNRLYQRILCESWIVADQLRGHPVLHIAEVENLVHTIADEQIRAQSDACFLYPETSANVQGFVRSRSSSPGIYLFSDTGAGTVDQSVFIFSKSKEGSDHLDYLHSSVIPLGSSLIELRAALATGTTNWEALEIWREKKESGGSEAPLSQAKHWIHSQLSGATHGTLAKAKSKLNVRDQIDKTRVIFGGGGHCEYPYKVAVIDPFSGGLFRRPISPDTIGMPIPGDLELEADQNRWMRRLSVAYGLSFERGELSTFAYPVQVQTPKSEELWKPQRAIREAPTKDEC